MDANRNLITSNKCGEYTEVLQRNAASKTSVCAVKLWLSELTLVTNLMCAYSPTLIL